MPDPDPDDADLSSSPSTIRPHAPREPAARRDDRDGPPTGRSEAEGRWLKASLFSIGDAVIVTDLLGKVTLLNPTAEFLTGWADGDARDRPIEHIFRIVDEVSRDPVIQPVLQVLENGQIHYLTVKTLLVSKDGSERSIDDSAAPILDDLGQLNGVVLVFRDISERRRQELSQEYDRLHGEVILATVREALLVLGQDYRVKTANRSYYDGFRSSAGETLGRSLFELGDGLWDVPELRTHLDVVFSGGPPFDDYQLALESPGLGKRSLLLNARKLLDGDEGPAMVLLAIEDMTVHPGTIRALAAAEIRFRRLFDAAKEGILILGADSGSIVDANPFVLELLGFSHEQLLGKKLWDIGLLGDVEASKASFRELQARGYVRYEDLPLETCDKRRIEVEVVSTVYRVGESVIFQCNIRDVSERRRVEADLKRAKELAEEAGLMKDRFLANLSHELRTPLTPVLATIAYVESLPNVPDEVRVEFESIRRNVELEARLIDDLLDVTRIGQGKLELHREVVNVHACLRSVLEICQVEVEAKDLEVSLALRAKVNTIWADSVRLQQVFWNLIKNAVKFTPAGGRIQVRTSNVDTGRMLIEVGDSGPGIEEEALARIFEPFEQANRAVTRRHGGLGLGLSIAKTIVDLHGGSLAAASEGPGKGSVFSILLDTISFDEPSPPARVPNSGAAQHRLLFLEDNLDTRNSITKLLLSAGYQVRTAGSVEEAIEAMNTEPFDLLISDIGLPDGTGLEVMRHGLARFGLKGIALSGYGTPDDVRESLEAGFSHHLTKPTNAHALVDLIVRIAP